MRSIKNIHTASYAPIADLITYSPLPSAKLPQLDPFLFLNHHGHQVYKPNNQGLPLGPHPHRGMETVTFILEGDIKHEDSGGYNSVINSGGVQYMRAGRGLLHAETSSEKFKKQGGPLEILQLWLNMPASHKMSEPLYVGRQADDIPKVAIAEGNGTLHLVFGQWKGTAAALRHNLLNLFLGWVSLKPTARFSPEVPATHTILCYVVRGSINVQDKTATARQLVEFAYEAGEVVLEATEDAIVLFGHAEPLREPVVAKGPFVMNTEDEIRQAYRDFQLGKFGIW